MLKCSADTSKIFEAPKEWKVWEIVKLISKRWNEDRKFTGDIEGNGDKEQKFLHLLPVLIFEIIPFERSALRV